MEYKNQSGKLPPKAIAIFEGVIKLVDEDKSLNDIKVADIAAAAGVGKGTVYEYFDNKEEILLKALIYDLAVEIGKLRDMVYGGGGFEQKIEAVFEWMGRNVNRRYLFMKTFTKNEANNKQGKEFALKLDERLLSCANYSDISDDIIRAGAKEGRFPVPEDRFTVDSATIACMWVILNYVGKKDNYPSVTFQEVKQKALKTFILLLQ